VCAESHITIGEVMQAVFSVDPIRGIRLDRPCYVERESAVQLRVYLWSVNRGIIFIDKSRYHKTSNEDIAKE
jgi:hypothetical protein